MHWTILATGALGALGLGFLLGWRLRSGAAWRAGYGRGWQAGHDYTAWPAQILTSAGEPARGGAGWVDLAPRPPRGDPPA